MATTLWAELDVIVAAWLTPLAGSALLAAAKMVTMTIDKRDIADQLATKLKVAIDAAAHEQARRSLYGPYWWMNRAQRRAHRKQNR